MTINESTLDMIQLDDMLDFLMAQVVAYKKAKRADHQSIMRLDLEAISILCESVNFIVKQENKREAR